MTLHAVRHFADLSVGPNATCFILSSGQISPAGVIVLPHKGKKLCLWPQTAFVMWLAYDATLSLSYSLAWLERFRRSYRVRSVEDLASFVINVWLLASLSPMVSMVRQEPSACWRFSRMEIRDGGCATIELDEKLTTQHPTCDAMQSLLTGLFKGREISLTERRRRWWA